MKTKIKIALTALLFTGLWSCTEDDNFMLTQQQGSFALNTPDNGTAVVLTPGLSTNPALTFSWSEAEYTVPTAVNYEVQFIKDGTANWDTFASSGATTATSKTLTVEELNGIAIASGLESDVAGVLNVRVKASIGSEGVDAMYSNVINITVTPYVTYPFTDLFLVGSAAPTGWDNNPDTNNYPLVRDPGNENIYQYIGYLAVGQIKLIEKSGSWLPQYGLNGGTVTKKTENAQPDPAPLEVTTAGYYKLVVNLNDNTYTFTPYDASSAAVYTTIGIIGTSTPDQWNSDTDMTQSAFDPHMWYINNQFLTAGDGKLKFRANNDWGTNWGGDTAYSGLGSPNGGDIPIGIAVAGNYDIWLNDLTGAYIYIPVE